MSIRVENNLKGTENKEAFEQRAHFIPCSINVDGPANVQKYFETYVEEKDKNDLKATFRGYPLDGCVMRLPEGHTAVLVTETKRPLAEDAERRFQVTGGFKEMVYWNWDKKCSKNDELLKAMDWIDIANVMHSD